MDLPNNLSKTYTYISEFQTLKEEVSRYILAEFGDFYDKPGWGLALRTNFLYQNYDEDEEDVIDMYIKKRFRNDFINEVEVLSTSVESLREDVLHLKITLNFVNFNQIEELDLNIE